MGVVKNVPFAARKGDVGSEMLPLPPAVTAKARTPIGTLTLAGAAQTVTLNESTAILELHGGTYGAAIKWGSTAVTNTNFDVLVPPGISHRAIPDGETNFSIDKATAVLPVVVVEY